VRILIVIAAGLLPRLVLQLILVDKGKMQELMRALSKLLQITPVLPPETTIGREIPVVLVTAVAQIVANIPVLLPVLLAIRHI
jgi:hypothetical protein